MAEKIVDLLLGAAPLAGLGPLIPLTSKVATPGYAPNPTAGTDQGNTPNRTAVLTLRNDAGTVQVITVNRPNPGMAGIGAAGGAENAQEIGADGVAFAFDSKFTYAAFANHNWIVEIAGYLCVYDAAPGPNIDPLAGVVEFTVIDNGGVLQVQIGDGTNIPVAGTRINVFQADPLKQVMLADALNA